MRRRHVEPGDDDDQVIDLRDRLAPYDDVALAPPVRRPQAVAEDEDEPPLWTPLEFDFDYQASALKDR